MVRGGEQIFIGIKQNIFDSLDTWNSLLNSCSNSSNPIEIACDILEESGAATFIVSGFGQEIWPVDCRYDLMTVIEQLPHIINEINNNRFNFELDFYEQGLQRKLVFYDNGISIIIKCESRTNWMPLPQKEVMPKKEVVQQFVQFNNMLLSLLNALCPTIANRINLFKIEI